MSKKAVLKRKENDQDRSLSCCLLSSSSSPPPKKNHLCFFYNNISLPWALAFSTIAPLLPLPSQNPLDHERRPQKMSFGDLELQIYSGVFFLGVTEVVLRRF